MILERKYFEYRETKPSNKLAPAIFPEFHCVALSIVYTFHPTMFFQTSVFTFMNNLMIQQIGAYSSTDRFD